MQRRHFMKLTGMLATLPAIKGIAATSENPLHPESSYTNGESTHWKKMRTAWTAFSATH